MTQRAALAALLMTATAAALTLVAIAAVFRWYLDRGGDDLPPLPGMPNYSTRETGRPADLTPRDLAELHEEARRITREGT